MSNNAEHVETSDDRLKRMTGRAWYKCRMCRKTYLEGIEGSAKVMERAVSDITVFGKDVGDHGMRVSPMDVHYCDGYDSNPGDRIGIADIAGMDITE